MSGHLEVQSAAAFLTPLHQYGGRGGSLSTNPVDAPWIRRQSAAVPSACAGFASPVSLIHAVKSESARRPRARFLSRPRSFVSSGGNKPQFAFIGWEFFSGWSG